MIFVSRNNNKQRIRDESDVSELHEIAFVAPCEHALRRVHTVQQMLFHATLIRLIRLWFAVCCCSAKQISWSLNKNHALWKEVENIPANIFNIFTKDRVTNITTKLQRTFAILAWKLEIWLVETLFHSSNKILNIFI